jgi:phosphate-selective porin OprO and OprP
MFLLQHSNIVRTFVGVLLCAAVIAGGAQAQDIARPTQAGRAGAPMDAAETQIAVLRDEIAALTAQVAELRAAISGGLKEVRTAQAKQTQVSLPNGRPTFVSADGQTTIGVRGMLQFDAAAYSVSPLTPANDLGSGTNIRRARIGVDGRVFGDWNYGVLADFGGTGGEVAGLNYGYLEYAGWKPAGLKNPVRLRIGAWTTATGLEDATANTEGLFLERPASVEMVRNFAGGDGRAGVGAFANGDHWFGSLAWTGKSIGVAAVQEFDQQQGYLARLAFNPWHGSNYDTHIGVNLQGVIRPADTAPGAAVNRALRLRERPEIRVDGGRLVDTGALTADGLTVMGAELGMSRENLVFVGEAFNIDLDRPGSSASFNGWYAAGAWTLTGERHLWNGGIGGFRGIRPAKVFDPASQTWGALEIAGRYSVLNLDDRRGLAGSATPVGGVRGGEQVITTLGLNWYPNPVVRILIDQQWISVDRLNGVGAQIGEDVQVTSLRAQAAF